jgi:tmRNA-binding protein
MVNSQFIVCVSVLSNCLDLLRYAIHNLSYASIRSVLIVCCYLYSSCASIKLLWSIAEPSVTHDNRSTATTEQWVKRMCTMQSYNNPM